MRTQAIRQSAVGVPRLEHFPSDGGPAEETPLESFPFSIGRDDSADLKIDSGRVSRGHAVILEDGGGYRVRDLGSTNGTHLNGGKIDEAPLADGDVLLIADVELTFFSGRQDVFRETVTQVIDSGDDEAAAPLDVIRQVRRMHEVLTRRGLAVLFQPVHDLETGSRFGYLARDPDHDRPGSMAASRRLLWATDCRLTGRIRQLARLLAAEEALELPEPASIFMRLDASEIGADELADSLGRLQDVLAGLHRLVVELPDEAVSDSPGFAQFYRHLKDLSIGIAYHGFAGSGSQVKRYQEIRPDFLELAGSLVRGIDRNSQRRHQVHSIVRASRQIGSELVAMGVGTQREANSCRELGCRLGEGAHFRCPRPAQTAAP